jgi:hypothetical protein
MEIKILGEGVKSRVLEQRVREVLEKTGIVANITMVEEMSEIMKYGIMTVIALVVNEKVEIKGRVPKKVEITSILNRNIGV